jgi:hypothetical protein
MGRILCIFVLSLFVSKSFPQTNSATKKLFREFSEAYRTNATREETSFYDALRGAAKKIITKDNPTFNLSLKETAGYRPLDSAVYNLVDSTLGFAISNDLFVADTAHWAEKNKEVFDFISNYTCNCIKNGYTNTGNDEKFGKVYYDCLQELEKNANYKQLLSKAMISLNKKETPAFGILGDTYNFYACSVIRNVFMNSLRRRTATSYLNSINDFQYKTTITTLSEYPAGNTAKFKIRFPNYKEFTGELEVLKKNLMGTVGYSQKKQVQLSNLESEIIVAYYSLPLNTKKYKLKGTAQILTKGIFKDFRITAFDFTEAAAVKNREELEDEMNNK